MNSEIDSTTRSPSSEALPLFGLPAFTRLPKVEVLYGRVLPLFWIILAFEGLHILFQVLVQYWYNQSFGVESIFWTNFWMVFSVFVVTLTTFTGFFVAPAYVHRVPSWARNVTTQVGLMVGIVAGYYFALNYQDFLLLRHGESFGKTDPVFGKDVSFFVFSLPALWVIWSAAVSCLVIGLYSSMRCASICDQDGTRFTGRNWLILLIRRVSTPCTLVYLGVLGVVLACEPFLMRYEVLFRDNEHLRIRNGPQYLDVEGVFSTLNSYWVLVLVVLGITGAIIFALSVLRRDEETLSQSSRLQLKRAGLVVASLLLFDLVFSLGNRVQQVVFVTPEEPLIQTDYIKSHIDNTMDAYGLDDVEEVNFLPNADDATLPDVDELLQSTASKNVPIWSGFVSYLETHIDPQHADRILQTSGDAMIYGPTKEVFRQQQKLRMYYDIINVDAVRYPVNDEKQLFVSAVRELPKYAPQPYLYHWGQRMMWYTHGYGMVAAWASQTSKEGEPVYAVESIPPRSSVPSMETENHSVYFGEGSYAMFLSNLRGISELDHPNDQGLEFGEFPPDAKSGVLLDSFLKRFVIGWLSKELTVSQAYDATFWELLTSSIITKDTKCHYWRPPVERLAKIAPFLYYDTNIWAVSIDGGIKWMVNGMTYTKQFPASQRRPLGDKATVRTRYPRPHVMANYIRDSVKCTVDGETGEVQFYKFADEPIANTWEKIYPDLFVDRSEMPQSVTDHLQYPLQLFHRQFDDIYKSYHMRDPLEYLSMEDLWDDCDEVLGPVFDNGEAITFSFEPYHWITDTDDGVLPSSSEGTQFTMAMPFTNEKAFNLRAIPMVYQDGEDYGRMFCLKVPKGEFRMSPEQADAAIDQEPQISEQISWWNRLGNDVIRGHTNVLVANNELIYVEPLFVRSQQEPYSQLKRVCVVFRGHARMARTLEEALRLAVDAAKASPSETLDVAGVAE